MVEGQGDRSREMSKEKDRMVQGKTLEVGVQKAQAVRNGVPTLVTGWTPGRWQVGMGVPQSTDSKCTTVSIEKQLSKLPQSQELGSE